MTLIQIYNINLLDYSRTVEISHVSERKLQSCEALSEWEKRKMQEIPLRLDKKHTNKKIVVLSLLNLNAVI